MLGRLRHFNPLQTPYIKINVKVTNPGITNGKPNIIDEEKYVLAPSAKKIGTYIRNQLFGSDLLTQTEGLDINWLMPTLGEALELAVYEKESFIYIHKFDNKVYLECIKKCDIHNLVQKYDKVYSCDIIQDFEGEEFDYCLKRHIEMDNGNTELTFTAYKREKNHGEWQEMSLQAFNEINDTDYKRIYELPYEVLINIDAGQDFFKDSVKFLNEEMEVYNTLCEEVQKTKTRIATTQHFQSGDIYNQWQPSANIYDVKTISVGGLQDFFTLLPGDKEHSVFEYLQGNLRINDYVDTFKFCDYQIIQMANLSPATFGYEKDNYQNVASVDLSMNLTEMTIEAIKKQIEPQVNHLIENIVKLQELLNIQDNKIPSDLVWDYGDNEKLDDNKKINTLQAIQRAMAIPYSTRAKILTPILNKLIDEKTDAESLTKAYNEEREDIRMTYEEI
ncbi:MAG: hypothetical protein U0K80_02035 [Methanobrevibacter sp.]|nr:hypothetical protein [Methanobrevibacter sp.]